MSNVQCKFPNQPAVLLDLYYNVWLLGVLGTNHLVFSVKVGYSPGFCVLLRHYSCIVTCIVVTLPLASPSGNSVLAHAHIRAQSHRKAQVFEGSDYT